MTKAYPHLILIVLLLSPIEHLCVALHFFQTEPSTGATVLCFDQQTVFFIALILTHYYKFLKYSGCPLSLNYQDNTIGINLTMQTPANPLKRQICPFFCNAISI